MTSSVSEWTGGRKTSWCNTPSGGQIGGCNNLCWQQREINKKLPRQTQTKNVAGSWSWFVGPG